MKNALLLTILAGVAPLSAQGDALSAPVRTTIEAMRANPDAFHNVKVDFTVQFASLGRISNPFFTKFTPTEFTNFYGWGDDQPIWQEPSYNDVFGMLFVSKSSPKLDQLYRLPLYKRIRCTGVVRNTFQDIPWVEVLDFRELRGAVDTPMLTHLHRGEKLMEQRLWQRAVSELSRVPGAGAPAAALRAAEKNLGTCMLRMGEPAAALGHLAAASRLTRKRDFELENLLATAKQSPGAAIDRIVDATTLRDCERPMWEAFEGVRPALQAARPISR